MIQTILIILLLAGALLYVARLFYRTFKGEKSDCGGCGGCSKIDVEKIEEKIIKNRYHS